MMYDYGYGYPGWGFGFTIVHIILIIVVIMVIIGCVRMVRGRPSRWHRWDHLMGKTPLDILKERYAKGEIHKEEFEQKKKDLAE